MTSKLEISQAYLSALRFLAFCSVLRTYMGVSGPSLLIESTDSYDNIMKFTP